MPHWAFHAALAVLYGDPCGNCLWVRGLTEPPFVVLALPLFPQSLRLRSGTGTHKGVGARWLPLGGQVPTLELCIRAGVGLRERGWSCEDVDQTNRLGRPEKCHFNVAWCGGPEYEKALRARGGRSFGFRLSSLDILRRSGRSEHPRAHRLARSVRLYVRDRTTPSSG